MSGWTDQDTIDHAMRALWALTERAGGNLTIPDCGPVDGAIHIAADGKGSISVSIAKNHGANKQ